jgi:DNA invertase Pin-like site-specific DNA recombinase
MEKITAIYTRVSSKPQNTRSQIPDLERWIAAQDNNLPPVRWFTDKFTGRTMSRPGWDKLQRLIDAGKVSHLVIWCLDRLGRTAAGLTKLFEELQARKVRFVSLRENLDLGTPSGRLVANVMASVAAYESETKSERILAGQLAAREAGKRWGGSKKGALHKITVEQAHQIYKMKQAGEKIATITRTTGVNRQTVYRILQRVSEGHIKIC